jgi:hypothetical protein
MIAGDQAVSAAVTEGAPEVTHGIEGPAEFGSDLGEGLATEVAFNDVEPRSGRYGAGHVVPPEGWIGL